MPPATSLSALVRSEPVHAAVEEASREPSAAKPRPRRFLAAYAAIGIALSSVFVSGMAMTQRGGEPSANVHHHGSAQMKHTTKGAEVRWRVGQTKVYLDKSLEKLGPQGRAAIHGAFDAWAGANGELPSVEFAQCENAKLETKPDGKNTVLVAPITVKGHEHDLAITLTYSDEQTGNIVEADIVINAEYPFRTLSSEDDGYDGERRSSNGDSTTSADSSQPIVRAARASCTATAQRASCDGNAYDVQNVATHEVGHFFGLGEDMEDSAATMYYCTSRCETHKRELTTSDTTVMAALYPASDGSESSEATAGCSARVAPRGGLAEAGLALAFALGALVRRRRAR